MEELKPLIDVVVQNPDIVRQFILKGYFDAICLTVFFSIALGATCCWGVNLRKQWEDREITRLEAIACLVAFLFIFGVMSNMEDILVIYFAPKAWLISMLMQLGKK